MLAACRPDVVVVCTPPHHLPIALDVLAAGADLLLEKPPVLDLAGHLTLADAAAAAGRAVQVNFQALGSPALTERPARSGGSARSPASPRSPPGNVRTPTTPAPLGRTANRRRQPGAGRRARQPARARAHAVPRRRRIGHRRARAAGRIEAERYRVHPIDVDDTTVLRLTPHAGPPVLAALTLAAEEHVPGRCSSPASVDGRCWSTRPTGCGYPATTRRARCPAAEDCWRTCSTTARTARR
ncbi:Gfo/Idh/MocA family oxidoreductase [Micromonospora sp. BRA006-A]|nr:Gfo/Idh/MocA family oxidoreductase [Micromonospora sp. BRA006-A]